MKNWRKSELERIIAEMQATNTYTENYKKLLARAIELEKKGDKMSEAKYKMISDIAKASILVGGTVLCVSIIATFEERNLISDKAMKFCSLLKFI